MIFIPDTRFIRQDQKMSSNYKRYMRGTKTAGPWQEKKPRAKKPRTASSSGYSTTVPISSFGALARMDEMRYVDQPQATTAGNPVPVGIPLNLVQSGTAIWQRDGNLIKMNSLRIRGQWRNAATTTPVALRLLVVYDNMNNGTIPAITTIMQNIDQAGAATSNVYSELSPLQRDRFKIIRDIWLSAPPCTNTAGVITNGFVLESTEEFSVEEYLRLKGLNAFFSTNSAPAVIGDLTKGGLFLYVFGTAAWEFTWTARLRFQK